MARPGWRVAGIPLLAALIFALTAALPTGAAAVEFRGQPEVLEGGVIEIDGRRFALADIDAPDLAQRCLLNGRLYPCGEIARAALMDLTAGVQVLCRPLDAASKDPGADTAATARCFADGYDLSEGMVYTGWALPRADAPALYFELRKRAEKRRHGLWRGRFIAPAAWARGDRLPEEKPQ